MTHVVIGEKRYRAACDKRHKGDRGYKGHRGRMCEAAAGGRVGMATLSRSEVEQRLNTLSGWTLEGDAIRKKYTFKDFLEAIAFVNRLAPEAEAVDHHP